MKIFHIVFLADTGSGFFYICKYGVHRMFTAKTINKQNCMDQRLVNLNVSVNDFNLADSTSSLPKIYLFLQF